MTLIEREEQLKVLDELFSRCRAADGQVVMIDGAVATGKTALLHAFGRQAIAAGAAFVNATASRTEQMVPLSVLSQLLGNANLPADEYARMARLIEDSMVSAALADPGSDKSAEVTAPAFQALCQTLLRLSERVPLVIGVDDIHHADVASLHGLCYLVRRIGSARVLVVVNESVDSLHTHPLVQAEFRRHPQYRHMRLAPLSRKGVAALLKQHLGEQTATQLAAACHKITGGNPLLVRALIEDHCASARSSDTEPTVGEFYDEAVLSCLYRCDPPVLSTARALAVLGQPATPAVMGRFLGMEAGLVARACDTLDRAGLLDHGHFRHRRAREIVLKGIPPGDLAAAHGHAADVLHQADAAEAVVARHLVAAEEITQPWAVPLLRTAADQALGVGDIEFALACLHAARQAAQDGAQKIAIQSALARAQWLIDPSAAIPNLCEFVCAALDGRLDSRHALALIPMLLWHGRITESIDIVAKLSAQHGLDPDVELRLQRIRAWLPYGCPSGAVRLRSATEAIPPWRLIMSSVDAQLAAAAALQTAMRYEPDDEKIALAEWVVQRSSLDEGNFWPILSSLIALLLGDQLSTAASLCHPLIDEASSRHAPTWRALLVSVQAEIAFRQGHLLRAEEDARTALTLLNPRGWGIIIGAPLGSLLRANTAIGRHHLANSRLRVPVPPAMLETPLGLHYLHARGQFYLATGRPQAALNDFTTCRDLMSQWRLDLPSLAPWRVDAAHAYLTLGKRALARDLAQEQIDRLPPGPSRVRGMSLRALAKASEVGERAALLNEAMRVLKHVGDRFELARVFVDLGNAQHALGDPTRARATLRTAYQMARQCHAGTLIRALTTDTANGQPSQPVEDATGSYPVAELSETERRVAALAVQGHTNREIARRLYITVSTVEQHLTRVYRKLGVGRRTELPPELRLDIVESV